MQLAVAYAQVGRKADALREAARAAEVLPVSRDATDGGDLQEDYAYIEMLVGETDAAVRRLAYLLSIPSDVSMNLLRADPLWIHCAEARVSNDSWPRHPPDGGRPTP